MLSKSLQALHSPSEMGTTATEANMAYATMTSIRFRFGLPGLILSDVSIPWARGIALLDFQKIILSQAFVGEGPGVADFNRDGRTWPRDPNYNSLRTAGNTASLQEKIVRIKPIPFPDQASPAPGAGSTYSNPPGPRHRPVRIHRRLPSGRLGEG